MGIGVGRCEAISWGEEEGSGIDGVCLMSAYRDQEAVKLVLEVIQRGSGGGSFGQKAWRPTEMSVREAADLLVSTALTRGTADNVTALVVAFQW